MFGISNGCSYALWRNFMPFDLILRLLTIFLVKLQVNSPPKKFLVKLQWSIVRQKYFCQKTNTSFLSNWKSCNLPKVVGYRQLLNMLKLIDSNFHYFRLFHTKENDLSERLSKIHHLWLDCSKLIGKNIHFSPYFLTSFCSFHYRSWGTKYHSTY